MEDYTLDKFLKDENITYSFNCEDLKPFTWETLDKIIRAYIKVDNYLYNYKPDWTYVFDIADAQFIPICINRHYWIRDCYAHYETDYEKENQAMIKLTQKKMAHMIVTRLNHGKFSITHKPY